MKIDSRMQKISLSTHVVGVKRNHYRTNDLCALIMASAYLVFCITRE